MKILLNNLNLKQVSDWADFLDMDESDRFQVLSQFTLQQIVDLAQAENRLPSAEISDINAEEVIVQGNIFDVQIVLSRQDNPYTDYIIAPHYPKQKRSMVGFYVLVSFQQSIKVDIRFQALEAGDYDLTIYAKFDSYIGVDTTSLFQLKVNPIIEQEQEQ